MAIILYGNIIKATLTDETTPRALYNGYAIWRWFKVGISNLCYEILFEATRLRVILSDT